MKIIAIEHETQEAAPEAFQSLTKEEALKAWELYQKGTIRELYFKADQSTAVLVLECQDPAEAQLALHELPLVKAGLIEFELIPLVPYPGFGRLFSDGR